MKRNKLTIFYILISFLSLAQKSQYYIVLNQNTQAFEKADLKSKLTNSFSKGKKLDIIDKEGDFVKTVDNQFIHKTKIVIRENKTYRVNEEIEILKKDYKDRMQKRNQEGLNLNSNSRDFIELPVRDSIKFENLKIKNE
jgi:S-adenosylmethionine hydrolase